ncbi:MAG: bacillithiol biosynthesis deacetylase BshB1 [Candidatus Sumerlaeota bacterium]|nr:bacillithiol biosynthesis deacetylase BshB1 [Candidatus Sumerlaeota bacterium]
MTDLSSDSQCDVLAIGAHPDDVELFCGGTIARLVAGGRRVMIADLTSGERGSRGTKEERLVEAAKAAHVLGVARRQLDCGDTLIENTEANRLQVIRLIRETRPSVVITHDQEDRHPDHRKTHDLVSDAYFYSGVGGIDTGQPRHRPRALFYFIGNHRAQMPRPSFAVDITPFFEKKLESVRVYRSQFFNAEYEGPDTWIASELFWRRVESRARLFGALIGADLAEAFVSPAPLPVSDIVAQMSGQ